ADTNFDGEINVDLSDEDVNRAPEWQWSLDAIYNHNFLNGDLTWVATYVGDVTVVYSGGTVTVEFDWEPGYSLDSYAVYAGTVMFPTGSSGSPTVAPGQYYIEEGLSGEIYVIVHAVVNMPAG
ncbi:MAG: hypothetical protein R6T96_01175, partial [Longimicrobiales bacterium]